MVTMHGLELEKEKLQLVREAEESRIMLQNINLLDDEGKKWLLRKKKRINDRKNSLIILLSLIYGQTIKFCTRIDFIRATLSLYR